MANTVSLPKSTRTLSSARTDWNTAIASVLQNFASSGQPSSIDLGDGTTGLQTGMLWYKAGSNLVAGQNTLRIYNGTGFTREGIAFLRYPSMNNANIAITNGGISYGDFVLLGDDAASRLYMVNRANSALVDVGTPPAGYTVSNADLLDSLDSTQFLRSDVNTSLNADLTSSRSIFISNNTANSMTAGGIFFSGVRGAVVFDSGNARIGYESSGTNFRWGSGSRWDGSTLVYTTTGAGASDISLNGGVATTGAVIVRAAPVGTSGSGITWTSQYRQNPDEFIFTLANAFSVDGTTFRIDMVNNRVGILTTTPSFPLQVIGTAAATTFNSTSDIRLKKDVKRIDNALAKIAELSGYTFTFKADDRKSVGLIAQEVEKIYPELVDTDDQDNKSLAYGNLIALLLEGIKELSKQIEELKNAN